MVQLLRVTEAAQRPTWWAGHRRAFWSAVSWLSALVIVVASAIVLWELAFAHFGSADQLLGRPGLHAPTRDD